MTETLLSLFCGDIFCPGMSIPPPGIDVRSWVVCGLAQLSLEIFRGIAAGGVRHFAESRVFWSLGEDATLEGHEICLPGIGTGTDRTSWCLFCGLEGDRLDGELDGLLKVGGHACGDEEGDEDGLPIVKVAFLGEGLEDGVPGDVWRLLEDKGGDWLLIVREDTEFS